MEEKRKGFFRSLFEKNRSAASEEPANHEAAEQQTVTSAIDEVNESARLEVKGTLLEAWQRWNTSGEGLKISLLGDGHGSAVALNEREMGLERVRLSAKIERDAKDFVRELDKLEETKHAYPKFLRWNYLRI